MQEIVEEAIADAAHKIGSKFDTEELVAKIFGAKSDFEKYFERWLPNRVQPGDEVFIFFSGHGSPNPKTEDAYLVPYDGDPTYLEQTGYPLNRLYAQLAKLPAKGVTGLERP